MQSASSRVIGVLRSEQQADRSLGLTARCGQISCRRLHICGMVGPSLSFGSADAVTVVSKRPSLADAAATAIGNQVKSIEDIPRALEFASGIHGVEGVIVVKDDKLGVWGQVELV